MSFPGMSKYKEEILGYNPSGESLSDLLTHKFGNFLMWSLLHEKIITEFATKAIGISIDAEDCFSWFDTSVRMLFRDLFHVKFKVL